MTRFVDVPRHRFVIPPPSLLAWAQRIDRAIYTADWSLAYVGVTCRCVGRMRTTLPRWRR